MKLTSAIGRLLLMALVCASCDDYTKDATDVALFITPYASDTLEVNAGESVRYEIEMHTVHNLVNRLQITSFDAIRNNQEIADVKFDVAQDKYEFVYTAPFFNTGSTAVTLTFRGWDDAGSMGEAKRHLKVIGQEVLVQEKTGIVLWNPSTSRPNALSFTDPTQPFYYMPSSDEDTSTSPSADLYMKTNQDFTQISFQSNTSAKFVRNNSFDYATATAYSIQTVYESSRREDAINSLKVNDIILVGHDAKAEGVFTVTNIVRDGTDEEQSVRLSYKGIERKTSE